MSEVAPSYAVRPVAEDVQLLARVLGVGMDELIDRALEDAYDRAVADPRIKRAIDALRDLQDVPGSAGAPREEPAPAGETEEPGGRSTGDSLDDDEEIPQARHGTRPVVLSTEQRQFYASVVREARMRIEISQVRLAEILGISPATVSMIERAAHAVAPETVRAAVKWAKGE